MADVDFGDVELFQQLDDPRPPEPTHIRFPDDAEDHEEVSLLRGRLGECDDYIAKLTEENKALRRKLKVLTRPSGITVDDANVDGPVVQIIYSNNFLSKQCRQEIEDSVCGVILRQQKAGSTKSHSSSPYLKPQPSAFAMDEDPQKLSSTRVRTTTEAFKVVGSVLYFTTFSVDKLGQPLQNENPQLTGGWEVPTYQQVFNQVIGTDGQDMEMKDKRPKSMCFNCGASNHQMRDCPKPRDMAAINERRKEFQNTNQSLQSNQRYHADEVEERFSKYKPGILSEELLGALGIDTHTLPPLIYRMRQLGYPPGWLKEAEMENSGLTLYDGNVSNDSSMINNTASQNLSYDVSKLVDFPGFNVPAPHKMKDSNHLKHNYAAYLSSHFASLDCPSNKRHHESDSSQQHRKRPRSSPDGSSDMDIESDPGTPYNTHRQGDFHFQPPLPPGSPCFSSPPPLPHGTPPATPTPPPLPKSTPPPTPTNGSPRTPRGPNWVVLDEATDGREDDLTLEELEEQQRLIWAALQNADTTTTSDSETPVAESSPSVSTPARGDSEMEEVEEVMDKSLPGEVDPQTPVEDQNDSPQSPDPVKPQDHLAVAKFQDSPGPAKFQDNSSIKSQDDSPQSPGPIKSQDDGPQSPGPIKSQDHGPQSPGPIKSQDDYPQSPGPVISLDDSPQSHGPNQPQEDSPQSPDPAASQDVNGASPKPAANKVSAVPHRSKFAEGIVPFEDTPEYTEVAEATGTYLRIRDLLKSSPRSLAKKKS
ncbi:zinc finger CCHC domain-containing protein 8 isoform X2 [Dunckerocampus dactyliophorus]|uniref:zinc finger CCHC domain-containing protein 8 isoform X2 n=1 Tax=Dunckerocampus dactyliophorus TaxID=161453 RepID=UPI002407246C|nr:zinc finger CCHC domain-containing protein 8 isoform X2 [Dunckerocampus dactyliophorus]